MRRWRQQGASNYVERHSMRTLCALSTFCIRTMGKTLCGTVVLIAIANAHTPDDVLISKILFIV